MKNAVFGWLRAGLAALVLSFAAPQPASADIRAFNAAVARKDYAEAAAEAERTWPTLDKTRTDIAVIAREFATMSMLAGQPQKARVYASFLVNDAAALPAPDDSPHLSRILLSWADAKIRETPESRQALVDAIDARMAAIGYDIISTVASSEASAMTFRANDWSAARKVAGASLELARRAGRSALARQRSAELALIAIEYVDRKDTDAYRRVMALDEQIYGDARDPANTAVAADLWRVHDSAWAWRNSMQAYFQSSGTPDAPQVEINHRESIGSRAAGARPDSEYCGLRPRPNMVDITYPPSPIFHGIVGAVIVDMAIDEDGRVHDPRIVAAVPSDGFDEYVLRSARRWSYRVDPEKSPPGCLIAREHQQLAVQFIIR